MYCTKIVMYFTNVHSLEIRKSMLKFCIFFLHQQRRTCWHSACKYILCFSYRCDNPACKNFMENVYLLILLRKLNMRKRYRSGKFLFKISIIMKRYIWYQCTRNIGSSIGSFNITLVMIQVWKASNSAARKMYSYIWNK